MIGLILTGHGQFAVGVGQALEMIAGKQAAFKVVPFLESDPMDALEQIYEMQWQNYNKKQKGLLYLLIS